MAEFVSNASIADICGRQIDSVWLNDRSDRLVFVFVDGTQAGFYSDGDCCSHSWIEGIELYGFKGKLLSVESGGFSSREISGGDYEDQEFITFKTEKGRLIIDLRTGHNGYYGGSLYRDDTVSSLNDSKHKWRELRESLADG